MSTGKTAQVVAETSNETNELTDAELYAVAGGDHSPPFVPYGPPVDPFVPYRGPVSIELSRQKCC